MPDKLLAEWFWTDRWTGSDGFLLPIDARGLYREMLTQAWKRGGTLPKNPESIRRATGVTPEEWGRCWPQVSRFWVEDGDTIFNQTQREIIADCLKRKDKAVAKAKHAADARWNAPSNASSNAQASPQAMHEQCPPSPSLSLSKTPSPSPKKTRMRAEFDDEFWPGVPKGCKVAKEYAFRCYEKARASGSKDEIVTGLAVYEAHEAARRGRDGYQPLHPSTWLNRGRWTDEMPERDNGGPRKRPGRFTCASCGLKLEFAESLDRGFCSPCWGRAKEVQL